MATIISRTTIQAAIGTETPVRITVLDKATKAAKDLSLYTAKIALKSSPDETATYLVSPTSATTDATGHIDATLTQTSMEAAAVVALAGETVTGEVVAYLSGTEKIRVQFPVQIKGRVIIT